jgi:hypothetical protein
MMMVVSYLQHQKREAEYAQGVRRAVMMMMTMDDDDDRYGDALGRRQHHHPVSHETDSETDPSER